jgi:hypothetical protein
VSRRATPASPRPARGSAPSVPARARLPRALAILGSGETAPTMVRVHRELLARLPSQPPRAVLLDTPFRFQQNADELVRRARAYFAESLGVELEVATLPDPAPTPGAEEGSRALALARFVATVRDAEYLFAGPGSPTYALRHWRASPVPGLLVDKLEAGGVLAFSSAAALTLGAFTVPVYEIYKVGEEPHWLEGLDVLAAVGMRAAVVPHFDNAEGGTHDTRYAWLGEARLAAMEELLPAGTFVLGVDEHTALVLDLDERRATVTGRGGATVRVRGRSVRYPSGSDVPLDDLLSTAKELARPTSARPASARHAATGGPGAAPTTAGGGDAARRAADPRPALRSPLLERVRELETQARGALRARDVDGAVTGLLELEEELSRWATDTPGTDELTRARASLRALLVELGDLARRGAKDPRTVVGPYVEVVLSARERARGERRFEEADRLRDALAALGVEVRDTPQGSEWLLPAGR